MVPNDAPENKNYTIEKGYDYYPKTEKLMDIAGTLHDDVHDFLHSNVRKPEGLLSFGDFLKREQAEFVAAKMKGILKPENFSTSPTS